MELLERDIAMNTVIFGFFAFAWFGWAQERPPEGRARWWLGGGSLVGLLLCVLGGIRVGAAEGGGALDEGSMGLFGIVLGLEFGLALIGVLVLWSLARQDYFAPWVCLVVGVHFFPLAPLLDNPLLYVLGVLLTLWPFLGMRLARRRDLAPSFTTGVGAGLCLLAFALLYGLQLLLGLT